MMHVINSSHQLDLNVLDLSGKWQSCILRIYFLLISFRDLYPFQSTYKYPFCCVIHFLLLHSNSSVISIYANNNFIFLAWIYREAVGCLESIGCIRGGATTFKRLFTKPSERFFYTVSYRTSRSAKGLDIYFVYQFDHPRWKGIFIKRYVRLHAIVIPEEQRKVGGGGEGGLEVVFTERSEGSYISPKYLTFSKT